ncbi:MAG: NADH-quinone oxidoreductase subunit C, partial [Acinetobacter sp.]
MAETENAMPESAQVDSRPAFAIVEELKTKFGENFYVQTTFEDFPTVWVERARVQEVLMFLRTVSRPYVMLFDLSAVDERLRTHRDGLPASDFTVFYHLLSLERNSDIRIKVALNENDVNLPTATNIWPNANWYEREAYDMFGINFEGHPMLRRILLPTYWEGHPLRKEYSARATEYTPYMQNQAKQDYEQEHLRFVPEDWGMKRGNDDEDFMFLNLGPNHPSAHGAFRIILQLDGEEVKDCVPDIGYHHRGVEKMAERQTWHSFIPYTDRVDYLGGCAQNMPYVMGVEQMAGITVPDRAQCIRVMMSELFRINNHLLYIGTAIQDAGGMTPVFYMFADRQKIYDAIEAITGYRMHPAWFRIGGTAHDLPNNWQHLIREILDWMPKRM